MTVFPENEGTMQGRFHLLITMILTVFPFSAHAGFEFTDDGQSINITNLPPQSKPIAFTAPTPPGEPKPLTRASRPESDPSAPALQIYNERYIPDTIKKKYNLTDSWYGDGMTQPGATAQPLPVVTPSEPYIVEQTQHTEARDGEPMSLVSVKPYTKQESWRARKGEPVRAVIKRWSQRDGTELMWATPDDPQLEKDFSHVGSLETAVTALLRSTGKELYTQYRSDGLTPVMMSPASTVTTSAILPDPKPATSTVGGVPLNIFQPKPDLKGPETRWFALSGASLAEVLQVWAEDANAQLIWQASSNYALKDSVSQVGHFEDAVFKALSQYDGDVLRPVGQLYADPATGQKVLLIRNDTVS
jgi:hypothetical protein